MNKRTRSPIITIMSSIVKQASLKQLRILDET